MSNIPSAVPALTPEAVALLSLFFQNQAHANATQMHPPAQKPPPGQIPPAVDQLSSSQTLFDVNEHASVDDFHFEPPSSDQDELLHLRREVETLGNELETLKRTIQEDRESRESKRFKLAGGLGSINGDQKLAREDLVRSIRATMKGLTGRNEDEIEGEETMAPDYTRMATESPNREIIERAAKLVAEENKSSVPGKYEYEGHEFTLDDLRVFARRTFNGWKAVHQTEKDDKKKKKKEDWQRQNRRYARQIALSNSRKGAREAYKAKHKCDLPDEVFDPNYMTEYQSELDTPEVSECSEASDDEDGTKKMEKKVQKAKDAHYFKMARKANISQAEQIQNAPVWEKKKKTFRSEKYDGIMQELDALLASMRSQKKKRGRARVLVPKVDFGKEDPAPPNGKSPILPFMVDPEWLAAHEEEGNTLNMADKDPEGFA